MEVISLYTGFSNSRLSAWLVARKSMRKFSISVWDQGRKVGSEGGNCIFNWLTHTESPAFCMAFLHGISSYMVQKRRRTCCRNERAAGQLGSWGQLLPHPLTFSAIRGVMDKVWEISICLHSDWEQSLNSYNSHWKKKKKKKKKTWGKQVLWFKLNVSL